MSRTAGSEHPDSFPRPTRVPAYAFGGSRLVGYPDTTITTTAKMLLPANLNRLALYITNNDATIHVRVGGQEVAVALGVRIRAASPQPVRLTTTGEIWVIAESGTPVLSVSEELL